jgi:excisionase family DNA binding protein
LKATTHSDKPASECDTADQASPSRAEGAAPLATGTLVPDKKNYTLKEAALYLNVSTRTIERLIQRRLIRRNKALRKILIPRTELDHFLERSI